MAKLLFTTVAAVFTLALASAIAMVANAPDGSRTADDNPFEVAAAGTAPAGGSGKLVLTFEPPANGIDRN